MKLIKKIAAIMLSVMMVLGMASVVSAAESGAAAAPTGNGKITINNAIPGQTYKIYKILDLESYNATTGNYAYKATTAWESFINGNDIKGVYVTIKDGYVTWKDNANAAEFAKKALAYANPQNPQNPIINSDDSQVASAAAEGATTSTVTFSGRSLGYYLVDSSAGALCSLDTTAKDVIIQEKNGVPSVKKEVQEDSTSVWGDNNTADIGQTVNFQTTITAQPGAQNYVLHDKMDLGLTFNTNSVQVKLKKNTETTESVVAASNYEVKTNGLESTDPCTFHVEFKKEFCDTLAKDDKIIVTYSATLNEKAAIAGEGNKNTTKLTYGDSSETTTSTTTTKTYSIPVFKYTKDGENDKALAGATFTLSKDDKGTNPIKLVSVSNDAANGDTYCVAKTTEAEGTLKITSVTTTASGKFTIKGLDADTYYLTETQQPAGYNKLSAPIKIKIDDDGKVSILKSAANSAETSEDITDYVKVQNNTGTILPTTGGNGTSLIYFLGAVLALVSGVVLITKQRMKNS